MTPTAQSAGALPDPRDYGRKGDLSLGTDLLAWLHTRCERVLSQGGRKSNFLRLGLPHVTAETYAASDQIVVARLGRALLVALEGKPLEAGQLYRALWLAERRRTQQFRAAIAKAARASHDIEREFAVAIEILEHRERWISKSSLAALVAKRVGRPVSTVRDHLKRLQWSPKPKK